jgi:hypothetical protein
MVGMMYLVCIWYLVSGMIYLVSGIWYIGRYVKRQETKIFEFQMHLETREGFGIFNSRVGPRIRQSRYAEGDAGRADEDQKWEM